MKDQIVYVEDDPINAFVFERLLKTEYTVKHYETGESCLEQIDETVPSIIFMDINLGQGKLDGIATMQALKNMEAFKAIPVVAITAFAFEEDRQRFLDAGFDFYLPKPVSREELKEVIQRLT